jgi:hypothetical protein
MKFRTITLAIITFFTTATAFAQKEVVDDRPALPHKIPKVELKVVRGYITKLPYYGEKNLFVFYIDPDVGLTGNKTYRFTDDIEERGVDKGPNLFGFGVLNLKDTFLPKNLIRKLAAKRTEKNHGLVLDDSDHTLRDAWGLGDCNNKFIMMIVSKEGEIVYMQKEEITKEGEQEFFEIIEKYRF